MQREALGARLKWPCFHAEPRSRQLYVAMIHDSKSRALMNGHVALLGDSVLDNGAYTSGGPDVVSQLTSMLPAGWRASLLAVDGAMMGDLEHQLYRLPVDATHVVVSIGGKDVLQKPHVLPRKVESSLEELFSLAKNGPGFERGQRAAID